MKTKFLPILAAAAIAAPSDLAFAQQHAHDPAAHAPAASRPTPADRRIEVAFPPELREHTLANMRDHLAVLQEVQAALAKGRFDEAGEISERRLGMTSLPAHGSHDVAKFMPQGMQDIGTAMHRGASRFAVAAQNAAVADDVKPALAALAEVTAQCVACHAAYRLK